MKIIFELYLTSAKSKSLNLIQFLTNDRLKRQKHVCLRTPIRLDLTQEWSSKGRRQGDITCHYMKNSAIKQAELRWCALMRGCLARATRKSWCSPVRTFPWKLYLILAIVTDNVGGLYSQRYLLVETALSVCSDVVVCIYWWHCLFVYWQSCLRWPFSSNQSIAYITRHFSASIHMHFSSPFTHVFQTTPSRCLQRYQKI